MKDLKNEIVNWIREWFDKNGDENTPAIVGVSGGKDSSVVAALCCEALGKDRVIGVLMPCGRQSDIRDSYELIDHLGINYVEVNIQNMYESTIIAIENEIGYIQNKLVNGNTQARLRMLTLYAISQQFNGRVSNNCNASERFIGYSTKYGDDAGDFSPLSELTSDLVVLLGKELGLSENLYNKTPIDGLENNVINGNTLTDEEAMGFTYDELNEFIRTGDVLNNPEAAALIEQKNKYSHFKRQPRIPYFKYNA